MRKRYEECGFKEEADSLILINFDRYSSILDVDEICSLVNYLRNTINERLKTILDMNEIELKEEIKRIQDMGY